MKRKIGRVIIVLDIIEESLPRRVKIVFFGLFPLLKKLIEKVFRSKH